MTIDASAHGYDIRRWVGVSHTLAARRTRHGSGKTFVMEKTWGGGGDDKMSVMRKELKKKNTGRVGGVFSFFFRSRRAPGAALRPVERTFGSTAGASEP